VTISETCIRRPVMTTLITASLIAFGLFGYRLLAVAALPAVDFPTIQITATLPGASPETMGASVAGPIERQLSTISGITSLTSTSALGTSSIVIQFDLNRNIDGAALDVQSALTVAARRLPIEMVTPPSFRKVNPADQPVIQISLVSSTLPISKVDDYGEITLAQQISQLPGVAQVLVFGAQKFAVRVQVDPVAAASRGISMEDVRSVLAKANSNTPVGSISGIEANQNTTLEASAAMLTAAEYRTVIAAYRNGVPVTLSDIANVVDDVENQLGANYYKNEKSIGLVIYKQSNGNTVSIVDSIYNQLPRFRAQVPPSIKMEIFADRSVSIRDSVKDVQVTLVIAIVLVVAVIFLFLRSASATIIASLAVPISLIASCAAMYAFNFSINNLTLMALTLSVGFVVDDAIVMLENIVRHIESGMQPFEAALKGSREVGFTIISITMSLIAVFIPVLLMGGMVGRVFREFAVTITATILLSGFVSLTLTPMLCARVLKSHGEGESERGNIVLRAFEAMFKLWLRGYEVTLDFVLKYRFATLLVMLGTLIGTVWLYFAIPKGFFPIEDTGFINVVTEGPSDISFSAMTARTRQVADILLKDPAVDYLNITTGVGGANATGNFGRALVALKPRDRREDVGTVVKRLRVKANSFVGVMAYFQIMQNVNIGGRAGKSDYQYTLQSSDTETLYKVGPEMLEKIAKIPGLRDVTGDLYIKNPKITLEIDRKAAAVYGVTQDQIRQELYDCFGNRQVASIYTAVNDYYVILECDPKVQADPMGLTKLFLKTNLNGQTTAGGTVAPAAGSGVSGATAPTGPVVPLSALVRKVPMVSALQVNHQGQQPAMTIFFSTDPGYALGQAVDAIRQIEQEEHLPASIATGFQGNAQVFEDSLKGQGVLVLAAVFATFIVLGILYESFIHPITILSGLPSAGVGALIVLITFKMDLSIIAMIGIVMLVGIVKKNAIMMIDFAIQRRAVGMSADEAIREGCLLRFRPIMMTTFAAIFGALPIALGAGAGSELRQPLGVAVVGGLLVSQLLTLYITPVVYLYLDKVDSLLKHRLDPPAGLRDEHEPQMPRAVAAE
jgi:hydrophobic/amphiphilic exporter-1 (mainly G- bacteria), HAE1 family